MIRLQFADFGNTDQLWSLDPVESSPYIATANQQWKLMLEVKDGSLQDGALIQQWTDNGLAPQRWRFERAN